MITCPHAGCNRHVVRNQLAQHEATECLHVDVACSWAEFGCPHRCPRHMMAEHETNVLANARHMILVREEMAKQRRAHMRTITSIQQVDDLAPGAPCASLCPEQHSRDSWTDAHVIRIAQTCPHLQHVDLQGCNQITDASITILAQHCPQLKYVDLSRSRPISREEPTRHHDMNATTPPAPSGSLFSQPQPQPIPTHESASTRRPRYHAPDMPTTPPRRSSTTRQQQLDPSAPNPFSANTSVTTTTPPPTRPMASLFALLTDAFPSTISVGPSEVAGPRPDITDESVRSLARYCPLLQRIRLRRCNITMLSIQSMHACSHLQHVNLKGCQRLDREQAVDALMGLAELQSIDVREIPVRPSPYPSSRLGRFSTRNIKIKRD
eukprot:TRINITY_DN5628_c0_g1_i3.p1 TRINITY_DN5628_c0_g1~~TRINITY_DN5628_c0_g1_i3.p1  ORF type:complete len:380 (-),score=28.82 TRINITY_DN5628_c0_g1_i3:91-1230(-)